MVGYARVTVELKKKKWNDERTPHTHNFSLLHTKIYMKKKNIYMSK